MAYRSSATGQRYTGPAAALGTSWTMMCWGRLAADRNDWQTFIGLDDGTNADAQMFVLQTENDGTTLTVYNDNTLTGPPLTVGTWYRMAVTRSGSTITLYAGAAGSPLVQAGTLTTAATNPATRFWIGDDAFADEWLNGNVANVKVYNAVLSVAEIEAELLQYAPRRVVGLQRWHPLIVTEAVDYSGNGATLTGGTGSTTEAGPPIPWQGTTPVVPVEQVVEFADTDGFSVSETEELEILALDQPDDDIVTVVEGEVVDVVAQSLASTDTVGVAEDQVMDIVAQSFTSSDTATVTDTQSLRIVDTRAVIGTRPLRIDFWLLDDAGEYVCPLPDVMTFTLTQIAGEAGAVSVDYPTFGRNYGLLSAAVTPVHDALIAIRIDGTDATSLRARLQTRNEDRVADLGAVTFGGHFLTRRLQEAVVAYQTGEENGDLVLSSATAGQILGTALLQAQARGTLTELTWEFTNTHDSNGLPWPTQTSVRISPGMDLLKLASQLRAWGMAEVDVSNQGEVRAYIPESVGIDWSLATNPVVLRRGRDLKDATRRTTNEDAPTDLLIAGADGVYEQVHDDTARALRGRQIEQYVSQGNLTDTGSVLAYGSAALAKSAHGVEENTFGLTFVGDGVALPLRDLNVNDWILGDTGTGVEDKQRIMQVTVQRPAGGDLLSGSVVLNDIIAENDVRLQRTLDGLTGGAVIAGTSVVGPQTDDGLAPAAPEGLGATSLAYYDGGTPLAQITASWTAVDTNSDGSPIEDLSGYEVQFRYQAGQSLPTDWITVALTSAGATSVSWDGLVQGKAVDIRVAAYDRFDHESDWSATYTVLTATDGDAPPTPSTPVVASYLGVLTVTWDGFGSAGEPQPGDFDHVEIHYSTTSGFTPDRPLLPNGRLDTAASTTYLDQLVGAGTMPSTIGEYGQTYYAKLVAVDRTGNASDASAQDSAVLEQAGDGDISALSIGKLTAGIMSALMTISGIIRTAATGARVELDTDGLRCYAPDGTTRLLDFDISANVMALTGRMQTDLDGSRVVVSPGDPSDEIQTPGVVLWADNSDKPASMYATPDGAGATPTTVNVTSSLDASTSRKGWVGVRNNAVLAQVTKRYPPSTTYPNGVLWGDGGSLFMASDSATLDVRTSTSTTSPRDGGFVHLDRDNAYLGHGDPSDNGYLAVRSDGDIFGISNGTTVIEASASAARMLARNGAGFVSTGGNAFMRADSGSHVVNADGSAYRGITATSFTPNASSAALKEGFEELPSSALEALRGAPNTMWRYLTDPEGEPLHIGPVVEDLPGWLRRPAPPATPRVIRRSVPAEFDDEGKQVTPPRLVEETVPDELPRSETIDLMSWISTVAEAVRELDAELDDLRRERGRAIPRRRTAADLLSDIDLGRLGGTRD